VNDVTYLFTKIPRSLRSKIAVESSLKVLSGGLQRQGMPSKEDTANLQALMNSDSSVRFFHLYVCASYSAYTYSHQYPCSVSFLISHMVTPSSPEPQSLLPIRLAPRSSNLLLSQTLLHHEAHHSLLIPSVLLLPVTALVDKTLHAPLQRQIQVLF